MNATDQGGVTFDDALGVFARIVLGHLGESALDTHRFIRDIDGRLSLLLLGEVPDNSIKALASNAKEALGVFATPSVVETTEDLLDPSLATDFAIGERINTAESGEPTWRRVAVVDRRVVGQDWACEPSGPLPGAPPILTFHSVKGGVGRSTALAASASAQAAQGRNVLVVDLDLEAPGIASLLLRRDDLPALGVIDWLVATNLQEGDAKLVGACIAESPLTAGRGAVDVMPALGTAAFDSPWGVVPKLGRALLDHPVSGALFHRRIRDLIQEACNAGPRQYDVVMVDARAGLAESAAAALIGLGAHNLCFGIDAEATFDGYRYLFSYLSGIAGASADTSADTSADPSKGTPNPHPHPHWCESFRIVHAKAQPGSEVRRAFRERTYEVFVDEVYEPDDGKEKRAGVPFSFDYDDEEAPHWPWPIAFDAAYAEIDPSQSPDRLSGEFADRAFGSFLSRVDGLIRETARPLPS